MEPGRRRILVAVEPVVLEGALASILERVGLDDVVAFRELGDGSDPGFDAAIVTIQLPDELHADVVITLPDTVGPGVGGRLDAGGRSEDVDVASPHEVIDLLDLELPATASRGDRLRALFGGPVER